MTAVPGRERVVSTMSSHPVTNPRAAARARGQEQTLFTGTAPSASDEAAINSSSDYSEFFLRGMAYAAHQLVTRCHPTEPCLPQAVGRPDRLLSGT